MWLLLRLSQEEHHPVLSRMYVTSKFHYRRDLMISAIRCGEKNVHKYRYRYRLLAKLVVKYRHMEYQQKIQHRADLLYGHLFITLFLITYKVFQNTTFFAL